MPVHHRLVGRQGTAQKVEGSLAAGPVEDPCDPSHSLHHRGGKEQRMECRRSLIFEALVQSSQSVLLQLQLEAAHRN